jgi:hypothetical protein
LKELTKNTEDATKASEDLANMILKDGGVLDAIGQEIAKVANLTGAYAKLREEILKAIEDKEKLIKDIDDTIKKETEEKDDEGKKKKRCPKCKKLLSKCKCGDDDGNDDDDEKKGPNPKKTKTKRGVALAIWNGNQGWGNGDERRRKLKEKGFDPDEIQDLVNNTDAHAGWESRYNIKDLTKYAYSAFDTGGYTGEWGPYGKFAMLHEKELVLNKSDTENLLKTMEFLDSIVKTIDLQATNAALGGLLNSPSLGALNSKETLEQNVKIEASFPNVSSRSEIEEAFETLVNRASQYANRK